MPRSRQNKAYVVTGPTSGIGRATALRLARRGTVVLVGRDAGKLAEVERLIVRKRGKAVSVVCDLSDVASAKQAAEKIAALKLPVAGVLNNAGMRQAHPTNNAQGWNLSFVTNYLGPFVLTEALAPHLPDGTNIVFIASAVENPERQPAKRVGFRGSRFVSIDACARGEWLAGGSKVPGFDEYATTKQLVLAAALAFARENTRLRFNAVEPGVILNTGLGRDASAPVRFAASVIVPLLVPVVRQFLTFLSTPRRAGRVIAKILTDTSDKTGVYYDESGHPMMGSAQVHDPAFQDRVVAETRAFLAAAKA